MITRFKIFENKLNIFHCYVPYGYGSEDIFKYLLNKIDIDTDMKNNIFEYLEYYGFFDDVDNLGCFLRFYDRSWDYCKAEYGYNKDSLIKELEDTGNFNSDLPSGGQSVYIGEITMTDEEISIAKNMNKYNL